LHRSGQPSEHQRLRIEDHCADLEQLCRAEGVARVILLGWSIGVQVALEHYRRHRDAVDALVLVNGAHGRVLHRSLGGGALVGATLPVAVRGLHRAAPLIDRTVLPVLQWLAAMRYAGKALRLAGVVTGEPPNVPEAVRAFLTLDPDVFLQMTLWADDHDTEDLLAQVRVPTLVIAGGRDMITRPPVARHIAATIPGASYQEITGATHYGVMEFPETYARGIDEFVRQLPPAGR